jgi:Zn finger protein HypA/HybF involved in hydrogenase expression
MDIRFECPQCKQPIKIDESAAGLQINCPGCQTALTIPSPAKAPQAVASQSGGSMQPAKPGGRTLPRLRAEPEPTEAPAPELAPPVAALGKQAKGGKGAQYKCNNPNCGSVWPESKLLPQSVAGKLSTVCPKCRGSVTQLAAPPSFWARMMGKK